MNWRLISSRVTKKCLSRRKDYQAFKKNEIMFSEHLLFSGAGETACGKLGSVVNFENLSALSSSACSFCCSCGSRPVFIFAPLHWFSTGGSQPPWGAKQPFHRCYLRPSKNRYCIMIHNCSKMTVTK